MELALSASFVHYFLPNIIFQQIILKSLSNATFYFSDKSTSLIQANLQTNGFQSSSQAFFLQLDWTNWLQNVELGLIQACPHFLVLSDTLYEDFLLEDVLSLIRFFQMKWKGVRVLATYQERGGRERVLMEMERWGMEGREIMEYMKKEEGGKNERRRKKDRRGREEETRRKNEEEKDEKEEEEMEEEEEKEAEKTDEEEEIGEKDEICVFEIMLKK